MTRLYISLILVVFTMTSIKNSAAHRAVCTEVGLFSSHGMSLLSLGLSVICRLSSVVRCVSIIRISNPYLVQISIMFLDCF